MGGATDIDNGAALCPRCNERKGDQVVADRLDMRPEQLAIAQLAVERASAHDPTPVLALLYPGFGKEWAWQHAAVELLRAGLIDTSVTYTPRINLCEQAELNWQARRLRYAQPRPDSFAYCAGNRTPLLQPPAFGYIATNAALVTAPELHIAFARERAGRFLLVGDEAAAFGAARLGGNDRDEQIDVKQTQCFGAMRDHAAVTILLTGADRRSDGRMLIGCEDRYFVQDDGSKLLRADITRLYRAGVARGYLRRIEVSYRDAQGNEYFPDGSVAPVTVSEDDGRVLAPLLGQSHVWRPMVDAAIVRLRAMRGGGHRFVAGIACRDQDHAKRVLAHARSRASDLTVDLAVSDERGSQGVLRRAMRGEVDVLVFVRQAFIGFDCPPMAVLCMLTHWRFDSFLTQLVGRALRIWSDGPDEQYAYVLTFADERSVEFFERMVEDARLGLRDRGPGPGGGGPGIPADIRDGELLDGERVQEHDIEHDDGARIAALREAVRSPLSVEQFRAAMQGGSSEPAGGNGESSETQDEQIKGLLSRAAANVKKAARCRAVPGTPQYTEVIQALGNELGRHSVFTGNGERVSLSDAQLRYKVSCQIARREGAVPA
jgi:hypothetical protein